MKKRFSALILSLCIILCLITALPVTASSGGGTAGGNNHDWKYDENGNRFLSGTCGDNLTWTLDENSTLTIDGTGEMTDFSRSDRSPWYRTELYIKDAVIKNSVTNISEFAFAGCTGLESVTIGSGVTSIENGAFYSCGALKSITIPENVTSIGENAFTHCWNLKSIILPDSVTSIGDSAFSHCTSLESITIPGSVISMGDATFSNCPGLTGIIVKENNQHYFSLDGVLYNNDKTKLLCYPGSKPEEHFIIPESVKEIENEAFRQCAFLASVLIPDSITIIGDYAFSYCSSLESISIPHSVTSIGEGVFMGCRSLKSVWLPNSITSIGRLGFSNCTGLESITIPGSVISIGNQAFAFCDTLARIMIPRSVVNIDASAFAGSTSLNDVFYNGSREDWLKISISPYNNDTLTNAKIHYVNMSVDGEIVNAYYDGNRITVNISLKYITDDCRVILGVYNKDGDLIKITSSEAAKTDSAVTLSCAADEDYNECHIKVFFWNRFNGLNPLGKALYSRIDG